jgi:hypothetical protein
MSVRASVQLWPVSEQWFNSDARRKHYLSDSASADTASDHVMGACPPHELGVGEANGPLSFFIHRCAVEGIAERSASLSTIFSLFSCDWSVGDTAVTTSSVNSASSEITSPPPPRTLRQTKSILNGAVRQVEETILSSLRLSAWSCGFS